MKRFVVFIAVFVFMAVFAEASTVNLAWDSSTSTGVEGYAVFDKNFQKPYNYIAPFCESTKDILTCGATAPDDRQSAFVARAWAWGPYDLTGNRVKVWSDNSNEVVFTPATVKPEPPRNFIVKILVAIGRFFSKGYLVK